MSECATSHALGCFGVMCAERRGQWRGTTAGRLFKLGFENRCTTIAAVWSNPEPGATT